MKLSKLLLLVILILSFFVRIYKIGDYPPSLNWDEVSHGYNAYSILNTLKDEWGHFLPLIFRAYGDFKLPLYIYLTAIPVSIFGLNAFSVRLISVISGTTLCLFVYLITRHFFPKSKVLPLVSASIIAFSPSTIFLSRIALEANLFLSLFTASVYLLLKNKYSLSLIIYSLCIFTYNSSRVILPIYIIVFLFHFIKQRVPLKNHLLSLIFLSLSIGLFLHQSTNPEGLARFKWVSLIDSGAVNQINIARNSLSQNINPALAVLLVNKATFFIYKSSLNYISHFNPQFLFFNGGSHYQFNIPQFYLFHPLLLPFFIYGIVLSLKNRRFLPFFIWLLVAPIPSAITRDAPHTLRSITILPAVTLLATLGFSQIYKISKKASLFYIFSVLFISLIQFYKAYLPYSVNYSWVWQPSYQPAIQYVKQNYHRYDQIVFTKNYGEPHEFILFYWPWDPMDYQSDPQKIWDYHTDWYWIDGFDKFQFINDWEIKDQNFSSNTLLVTTPGNFPTSNAKLLQVIEFLDHQPAFDIVSYE